MKRILLVAVVLLFLFWPQKKGDSERTVTETLLHYNLVKSEVLAFEINKGFIKIENKIDSLKNKKQ